MYMYIDLTLGCANPPLGLNFESASILCGDQYVRQHRETFLFHQQIFLGGGNHKKVEFQSSWNNMVWVV